MKWLCLIVVAACGAEPSPTGDPVTEVSRVLYREIPVSVEANVDVLFVIDNSPSMAAFQTKLATNYRELIAALQPAFGADLHVGVVTTDPADAGKLTGAFLTTELQFDGTVKTNATGTLGDAFVTLASVSASGSASPQPLEMAVTALGANVNPGFLRPDAYLSVVVLSAGDDTSVGPLDSYATALKALKPDPSAVIVSAAYGPCSNGGLSAVAAPRLAAFLDLFPNRSTHVPICDDNIDGVVGLDAQLLRTTLGTVCADVPVVDCVQWMEQRATLEQRLIPRCPSASAPCWSLVVEPQNCISGTHEAFKLEPAGFRTAGEVTVFIECTIGP